MLRLLVLLGAIALIVPAGRILAAQTADPCDTMGLHQIEITFHQAATSKDVDLMTSLFADDATLAYAGKTYTGKSGVRDFFATVAAPFKPQNHWVAYTPAFRIRTTVQGDRATLYFECLYVDADSNAIKAHTFSDDTLVRSNGKWLIETMEAGAVETL
jgi:ketosteroid isomerase-like protein